MSLLTIGVPVLDGARYLRGALEALLAQTFREFALVVSDNQSKDATAEICQEFASRDSRLTYVRQPRFLTAVENFRYVLARADSPYFMWAAYDDLWAPDYIEQLVRAMQRSPAVLWYGRTRPIDELGRPGAEFWDGVDASSGDPRERLRESLRSVLGTRIYGLWRREDLATIGLTDIGHADDQLLLHRAAWLGPVRHAPEAVFYYRFVPWSREEYDFRLRGVLRRNRFKELQYLWKGGAELVRFAASDRAFVVGRLLRHFAVERRSLVVNDVKSELMFSFPGMYRLYRARRNGRAGYGS